MKSFYSLEEVISASRNTLSINDIKDYCRKGLLHPCIYFEGNIIAINQDRKQYSPDKRDPVVRVENKVWAKPFSGYVHNKRFINFLGQPKSTKDHLFEIDSILEKYSEYEIPELQKDQIMKVYDRRIDDDIRDFYWEKDLDSFEGREYSAGEIVFHIKELKQIHFDDPNKHQFETLKEKYIQDNYELFLYAKPLLTLHEAACIVSSNSPVFVETYKDYPDFAKYFQNYIDAFNLIFAWIKAGILKNEDELISNDEFKLLLIKHSIEIEGYNSEMNTENEAVIIFEGSETESLSNQLEQMRAQIKKLERDKEEYLKKIERLELELDIKNDDLIKASVNNGLLSAIVKKLEDRQSVTVDELIHLQKNGLYESININENVYTTPALEAVYGVIKAHWIDYDPDSNQPPPKQSTVTDWIKTNYPAVQAEDICKYIDKICRHPKAKRGGNIKVINNKIPPKASPQ